MGSTHDGAIRHRVGLGRCVFAGLPGRGLELWVVTTRLRAELVVRSDRVLSLKPKTAGFAAIRRFDRRQEQRGDVLGMQLGQNNGISNRPRLQAPMSRELLHCFTRLRAAGSCTECTRKVKP